MNATLSGVWKAMASAHGRVFLHRGICAENAPGTNRLFPAHFINIKAALV